MFWVWRASPPDDSNAPSHSSLIVTEFLTKRETKVIAQPPYLPDLAPCDFFLFPKLKYPLRRTCHESIESLKRNSLEELKAIPAEAYKKCMENWINRWDACIGSKGAYFESDNKELYLNTIHENVAFFNQFGSNFIRWYRYHLFLDSVCYQRYYSLQLSMVISKVTLYLQLVQKRYFLLLLW